MKILTLPLKRKWFDMIKACVKLEEYREINEYWATRRPTTPADAWNLTTPK